MQGNPLFCICIGGVAISLMDKLQSDRDTQISAACIVFFVIAFPVYFGIAASIGDLGVLPGPKGDYEATVSETNLTLGENELDLQDDEPQTISFDTDSIATDLEGSYIAYVRFTISWAETNEQGQGQDQCDEVSIEIDMNGVAHNVSNITTEQYDENGNCADGVEHVIEFEMIHNYSMINSTHNDVTESEAIAAYDDTGYGRGVYNITVEVDADAGQITPGGPSPGPLGNNDQGETVTVKVEFITIKVAVEMLESND
jgi:hypothetical protein